MLSISSKYFKILSVLIIIAIGIFLRTYIYLQGASIFGDEGSLVANFYDKGYLDLFFPLKYEQGAPPFFLIISKFMLMKFGLNVYLLRLVPYLSSIASLVLFSVLCTKIFKRHISVLVAVFLFSFSIPLVEFSQVLKQYSSDVLFSIIAMLVVLSLDFEKVDRKKAIILGFLIAVSFWFSYTIVFIALSLSIIFIVKSALSKNNSNLKNSIIFALINLFGFLLYYFTNLHGAASSTALHAFWVNVFGFFPNTQDEFSSLNYFIFNNDSLEGLVISALLFIFGIEFLFKNDKFKFWVIVTPILCVLVAGAFHLYPASNRQIMFLIPNIIIIMSASLDFISSKKLFINNLFITALVVVFIISTNCVPFFVDFIKSKVYYQNCFCNEYVSLLKKEKIDKNSIIFINPQTGMSFDIYARGTSLYKYQLVAEGWNNPRETLNGLPHKVNVYFFISSDLLTNKDHLYAKQNWIKNNCLIKKDIKTLHGRFIKCYVK